MATPEQVRAALLAAKEKKSGNGGAKRTGGDNASYPFWNIPFDSSATVRFLPDGDPDNMFFWVKREVIKLPFAGVVGGEYPTDREVTVTVPCIDMFGLQCPIIAATRPWWKDPAKEDLARRYWKKKSYIFQGFVVDSPMAEDNLPENPIRRFVINPSIFEVIEKSLISSEMEDMPTDYNGGRDFKIAKTKKGDWANYATSTWSFKVRPLSETELGAISHYGLHDLKQALGKCPDASEVEIIKAMFDASVAGEPFDYASFGEHYRPFGSRDDGNSAVDGQVARATAAPAAPAPVAAAAAPAASGDKPDTKEILARIKARTANNQTGN